MKYNNYEKRLQAAPITLKILSGMAVVCSLLTTTQATAETVVSGQSDTILRIARTAENKFESPAYEYLRLGISSNDSKGGTLSANFGGWGRANPSAGRNDDGRSKLDSDLQYGYLSYQAAKGNFIASAGRQFVTEGVAAERVDGIYLRSDIAAGFAASVFSGNPVVTHPDYEGGDVIFGGRISHTLSNYYTIGVSGLRSSGDDSAEREEIGADIWFHPIKMLDVTGRSTYNSVKNDWMEHSYMLSIIPIEKIRIGLDFSNINYRYYFSDTQTTSVFKLNSGIINPDEEMTAFGTIVSYAPYKNLAFSGDYKHYEYEIADAADYFGGKISYSMPESYAAGAAIHRMQGGDGRLRYTEYRIYTTKKLNNFDVALDLIEIHYDEKVNDVSNAFTAALAAGYRVDEKLKFTADLDYSSNPDYYKEVRALVKLTYAFDMKYADEGGAK